MLQPTEVNLQERPIFRHGLFIGHPPKFRVRPISSPKRFPVFC